MKIVIDMNLSPTWVEYFNTAGVHAQHWSALGDSRVIQVRTQDPVPESVGELVLSALQKHSILLARGALITIEPHKLRARVLPIIPGMKR